MPKKLPAELTENDENRRCLDEAARRSTFLAEMQHWFSKVSLAHGQIPDVPEWHEQPDAAPEAKLEELEWSIVAYRIKSELGFALGVLENPPEAKRERDMGDWRTPAESVIDECTTLCRRIVLHWGLAQQSLELFILPALELGEAGTAFRHALNKQDFAAYRREWQRVRNGARARARKIQSTRHAPIVEALQDYADRYARGKHHLSLTDAAGRIASRFTRPKTRSEPGPGTAKSYSTRQILRIAREHNISW